MADVLCIGIDDAAMRTRKLILEKAGHIVTQARDLRRVQAECEANSFPVAILGHSLNGSEKMRVTDVLKAHCKGAKVLELHKGIEPDLPNVDRHLQITSNQPEALVEAVNELLRRPQKKKVRPAS